MQKIFSQEIRFKQDDGSDFPDWEEVTLKDAVYMKSGGTPKSTVETYYNGSIRFLSISDFSGGDTVRMLEELL
jgi:type I restriction enzyme S subunit